MAEDERGSQTAFCFVVALTGLDKAPNSLHLFRIAILFSAGVNKTGET